MEDKISVIVPVYNVEPYLKKCVESVLCQTHYNLEVILIDDGSTDNSGKICDEFQERDNRVIVIHQVNKGQAAARNVGLDIATGDWIAFLDGDDWINNEMYEILLKLALEYDADISTCNTRSFYLGQDVECNIAMNNVSVLSTDEIIEGLLTQDKVRFEIWNKLWKHSLIGNTRFIEGQLCEEVYFDRILFLKANKMVHVDAFLHNYLIQRPGNTNSSFKNARLCIFKEFDLLIVDLKKQKKERAIEIINCIATEFAIALYEIAIDTGQNDDIKHLLRYEFKRNYSFIRYSKYRGVYLSIKALLFRISPVIFSIVRKCKSN